MHQARRVTALLLAGALALAACSSDDEAEAVPPIGGEDADDDSSTGDLGVEDAAPDDERDEGDTADDEEPFAVPDEIDEDYAEQVVNALLEIDTDILVTALGQEAGEPLDPDALDQLHAITAGEQRTRSMERLQARIDRPELNDGLLPPEEVTATVLDVDDVIHAEPNNCVLVAGFWDLSGTASEPPGDEMKTVFSLSRIDRGVTSVTRNPTPWAIRDISVLQDGSGEPIPRTEWETVNFPDDFDRTCKDR